MQGPPLKKSSMYRSGDFILVYIEIPFMEFMFRGFVESERYVFLDTSKEDKRVIFDNRVRLFFHEPRQGRQRVREKYRLKYIVRGVRLPSKDIARDIRGDPGGGTLGLELGCFDCSITLPYPGTGYTVTGYYHTLYLHYSSGGRGAFHFNKW